MEANTPPHIIDGIHAGPGCRRVEGFHAVVCLDPYCRAEAPGARVYCYPVEDFSVQPLSAMARALARLVGLARAGARVYVHCRAGCGRTGALVAGYLILVHGMEPGEAVEFFRERRGCGVEVEEQYMFLEWLHGLASERGLEGALGELARIAG